MYINSRRGPEGSITIRLATEADAGALRRLAQLDSRPPPPAPALVALAGGRARAAISLRGGDVVADPFHRTAELVSMLELRRGQLRGPRRSWGGRILGGRRAPRLAPPPGRVRPLA